MFPLFSLFNVFDNWALLALRLVLGAILLAHGFPKLKNIKETSANFTAMGFKPGSFWAPLIAVMEFFGGIFLILGIYASVAASVLAVEFLATMIWRIKKRHPFVNEWELDALILAALLVLLTVGVGNMTASQFLFSLFY